MGSSETFCLKWDDFLLNTTSSFRDLRKEQEFADVTLVLGGNKTVEAHKIVLASGSQFFKSLLTQHKHPHPLIYLRNMHEKDIMAVVDFLYHGEVNILQENLDNFLNLAEELKLKGLSGHNDTKQNQHMDKPQQRKGHTKPFKDPMQNKNAMFQSEDMDKMNTFDNPDSAMSLVGEYHVPKSTVSFKDGNEELDNKIRSMMDRIDGAWTCTVCGKVEKLNKLKKSNRSNIKKHIESMHMEGGSHPCGMCEKVFSSRNGLQQHISRNHTQYQ